MAVISAFILDSPLIWDNPLTGFQERDPFNFFEGTDSGAIEGCAQLVPGSMPVNAPVAIASDCMGHSYVEDFYDRIHLIEAGHDLGTILSDQTVLMDVWNAWRVPKTLTNVSGINTTGFTLTGDLPPPDVVFAGLEVKTYQFDISADGSPVINAAYTFDFTTELPVATFVGQRITLFPFFNNWKEPFTETLEYKTNVIEARSGAEQRIGLRGGPRHFLQNSVLAIGENFRELQGYIRHSQGGYYGIPVWQDQSKLLAAAPIGSLSIEVDTSNRGFRDDGFCVVLLGTNLFEVLAITTVVGNTINLVAASTAAWGKDMPVFPVEYARLEDSQPISRINGEVATAQINWQMRYPVSITPMVPPGLYNGMYVLEVPPNWAENRELVYGAKMRVMDGQVGLQEIQEIGWSDKLSESFYWWLQGRSNIAWFRSFLAYLDGRRVPFWLPSWTPDIIVVTDIQAADDWLECRGNYLSKFYTPAVVESHCCHFRMELYDGTVFYRHIVDTFAIDSTKDKVVFIDPDGGGDALGRLVTTGQVRMVSFMRRVRSYADRIDLVWHNGEFAECKMQFTYIGVN